MPRTPTTTDTTVEWEERVTDPDSESITLSLVLDAVDDGSGFTTDGTDSSNLSWLSFSKNKSTLADGTTEVLVNIVADKSGLDQGYTYRFKITADDGTTAVDRTFTLSIEKPPLYSGDNFICAGGIYVEQGSLSTSYDINTLSSRQSQTAASGGGIFGVFVSPDGSKVLLANDDQDEIERYDLTTPFDTTTLSAKVDSFSLPYQPRGLYVSPDGKNAYVQQFSDIYQYSISTAWDVSTASQVNTMSVSEYGSIFFSQDGTKFFRLAADLYSYNLSTPWDISTRGSVINQVDPTGDGLRKVDLYFKSDGTKLYVLDQDGIITQFDLPASWDISSLSGSVSYDPSSYASLNSFGLF